MFNQKYSSVSNWESSYFGGYEGVVYDHPQVIIPEEIKYYPPSTSHKLNYFTRDKLIRIFLNKVSTNNLVSVLLSNCNTVETEEKNMAIISTLSIKITINKLAAIETELANLFYFYEDFLCNTEIEIELPKNKKSKDKSKGTDDNKEDNQDASNNGENKETKSSESKDECNLSKSEIASIEKKVNKIMKEIFVGKPKNYVFNDTEGITNTELKKKTKFIHVKKSKKCKFSSEQISETARLLNILDINFQPKEDKVSNLKLGKVDVSKIAEIPSGNTHVYYKIEENVSTRPFSVCILADESGSMRGSENYSNDKVQNHVLKILYRTFSSILPPDKIYIYGHSGVHYPEIRIYNDKYNHTFEERIDNQFNNYFGENYDGPVIENIYEKIRSQTNDNIIFISISDGEPWGHDYGGNVAKEELKRIIEKCKRDGFVTVGIGFKFTNVKDIYQYHTVVDKVDMSCAKQIGGIINQVVKSEFQC